MRIRSAALGGLMVSALALAACDGGTVVLWPWFDASSTPKVGTADTPPAPPAPGGNPGDPTARPAETPVIDNPGGNAGAPPDGTPFETKPVNDTIPISDSTPPVSAETGAPVTLPPAPTETNASGPNTEPTTPATPTTPETPPATTTTPTTQPTTPTTPPATPETPAKPTPSFFFFRPGNIEPGSGIGTTEVKVLVPDMLFPIKSAPAFPQSQVYRYGGGVKGGDQCDVRNFKAPWRDNFCETRSSGDTTFCTAKAHLGQDIRVGTPEGCKEEVKTKAADRAKYEIQAVEDGVVSNVGSYSISIRANSGGRIYRYLHLNMKKLKVAQGQAVKAGDVVGYVSNDFGGTPTTLHLHFEIKLNTAENGWQYAPPYASLLEAYKRREKNAGEMVEDNFVVASAPGKPN